MFAKAEDAITFGNRSYYYSAEQDYTGQDARRFMERVNDHFSHKELKEGKFPEVYKLYYLLNHLEGRALRWFINQNFDITTLTWESFTKEFKHQFYNQHSKYQEELTRQPNKEIGNIKASNQEYYTRKCIKEFLNKRDRDVKHRGLHACNYNKLHNYNKDQYAFNESNTYEQANAYNISHQEELSIKYKNALSNKKVNNSIRNTLEARSNENKKLHHFKEKNKSLDVE